MSTFPESIWPFGGLWLPYVAMVAMVAMVMQHGSFLNLGMPKNPLVDSHSIEIGKIELWNRTSIHHMHIVSTLPK